jgi:hypothetical protein
LQCIDVNIYISCSDPVLWPILDFSKIASAFSKTDIPHVLFRVPKLIWPDAAVTNPVTTFCATGWGRQPGPEGSPDISDNALGQYPNMTLKRPLFCKGGCYRKHGEDSRDGVRPN